MHLLIFLGALMLLKQSQQQSQLEVAATAEVSLLPCL